MDMKHPTHKIEPNDMIEPIETALPTEPIDRMLPTDPMESTEPFEPMLSTEDSEPMDNLDWVTEAQGYPSGAILGS
jgi:hypothetical protein